MKILVRNLDYRDIPVFLELLAHLSPPVSLQRAKHIYSLSLSMSSNHYVYVAEVEGKIVGTATMLIENKFTCGTDKDGRNKVAHLEDVVVLPEFRKMGVASALVGSIIERAKREPCRKIVLSCRDNLAEFYDSLGFAEVGLQMDIIL